MFWKCVLTALEFVYSTGKAILEIRLDKRPESLSNLCAASFSVVILLLGLVSFASIREVRQTWPICYGVWPDSIYGSVEKNYCIVTQSSVTCGLIAWYAGVLGVMMLYDS